MNLMNFICGVILFVLMVWLGVNALEGLIFGGMHPLTVVLLLVGTGLAMTLLFWLMPEGDSNDS